MLVLPPRSARALADARGFAGRSGVGLLRLAQALTHLWSAERSAGRHCHRVHDHCHICTMKQGIQAVASRRRTGIRRCKAWRYGPWDIVAGRLVYDTRQTVVSSETLVLETPGPKSLAPSSAGRSPSSKQRSPRPDEPSIRERDGCSMHCAHGSRPR